MSKLDNRGVEEILLEMGVINISDFKKALAHKKKTNKNIEDILMALKIVSREDILKATAVKFGVRFIDLDKYSSIDKALLTKISKNLVIRYNVLPLKITNGYMYVAMHDVSDINAIDDLKINTGFNIKPVLCHKEKIRKRIEKYYAKKTAASDNNAQVKSPRRNSSDELKTEQKSRSQTSNEKSLQEKKSEEEHFDVNKREQDNKLPNKDSEKENVDDSIEDEFDNLFSGFDTMQKQDDNKKEVDDGDEYDVLNDFQIGLEKNQGDKDVFEDISDVDELDNLDEMYDKFSIDLGKSKDEDDKKYQEVGDNLLMQENQNIVNDENEKEKEDNFDIEKAQRELENFEFDLGLDLNDNDEAIRKNEQKNAIEEKSEEKLYFAKDTNDMSFAVNYDVDLDQKPLFKEKLGNYLVKNGIISDAQLNEGLKKQKETGQMLGKALIKKGYITRKILYKFLEKQLGVKYIDLETVEIQASLLNLVNETLARRHSLVPFAQDGNTLKVAMSDPLNIFSIDDLRIGTGLDIQPYLADDEQIRDFIDIYYEKAKGTREVFDKRKELDSLDEEFKKVNEQIADEIDAEGVDDLEDVGADDKTTEAPIVKMVNIIFQGAVARKASDIHIEPQEDRVLVRYRVDGNLIEIMEQDKKNLLAIVARIKIISGLNIAEKRIPQDGRITIKIQKKPYDMRISILPTMFGEKVVARIVDKESFNVTKEQLGFFGDDLKKFENILSNPHGIVLVTGPTGSGKSTTLYTALKELAKPNINLVTVEDPVESTVKGVNQVQVNAKAGLTFATALRSFLRQDPDIIMLGEIRDGETAEIAVKAAITGHLVLSTLHTNDAPSTITRIIDMGIESYLISSSVVGIIAQRLLRRLCKTCKGKKVPDENERKILKLKDDEKITIYKAVGCEECNELGYKGRIAVHEVMTLDRELRNMITKNATSDELKDLAVKNGMKTLSDNCIRLIKSGVTTIEEMLHTVHSDI